MEPTRCNQMTGWLKTGHCDSVLPSLGVGDGVEHPSFEYGVTPWDSLSVTHVGGE